MRPGADLPDRSWLATPRRRPRRHRRSAQKAELLPAQTQCPGQGWQPLADRLTLLPLPECLAARLWWDCWIGPSYPIWRRNLDSPTHLSREKDLSKLLHAVIDVLSLPARRAPVSAAFRARVHPARQRQRWRWLGPYRRWG